MKSHRILTGTLMCVSCTSVLTKHIQDIHNQALLVPASRVPIADG